MGIVSTKAGPISGHQGSALSAFPDVCRMPGGAGPVPIPYPNIANAAASKQARGQQLRGKLQHLHMQIASLPSGDPTRWHRTLDEYVVLTAELYKTLSE
jgi:hypothetical protein